MRRLRNRSSNRSPRRRAATAEPERPKVPRRTCVGCRRTGPSSSLVRVSRGPDGELRVGPGPGRGAWLCAPPEATTCLTEATRRRALDSALRGPVRDGEVGALRAKLEAMSG